MPVRDWRVPGAPLSWPASCLVPLLLAACDGPKGGVTHTTGSGDSDSGDTAGADTDGADSDSADSDSADSGDAAWTLPERPDTDHPGADVSWRWGGGEGYPDTVDPTWPVVRRVADFAGLEAALAVAVAGDVVYVDEGAEIDLTGRPVCVPGGVWLAGGRGVEGAAGALLYATEGSSTGMLQACGEDVRITGLRIRGPDPETCPPEWPNDCPLDVSGDPNCAYCTQTAYGISTTWAGLEVDNNELSGWTYTAVGVQNALAADVHHNHIHHGWREGLGYGVVLYGAEPTSALIRWNRFDAMRHVVAGQGYPGEDYEARDNLVGDAAISHVFDMHGQNEAADDGSPYAGGDIRVHGNIVMVPDQYSFVVRGRPETGAWFYDNCVAPAAADATDQRYYTGNFSTDVAPDGVGAPNAYGQSASDCGTLHWCLVDGGTGAERYGSATGTGVSELLVGDLDGDGRDDVFDSTGSEWRYANPDGGSWTTLASSGTALSQLALVDLDGDGVDDVFWADGSAWQWSRSGRSSWATLKTSSAGRADVAFGDFDGDGAVDVFTTDGARWSYHPRGSGAPVGLATSSAGMSTLAIGDFDGDGVADVFNGDGTHWRWSRSGTSSWANLATSGTTVASLTFADMDGDGRTDVIGASSERLRVSWAGVTSWETLRYQREGLGGFLLGDFNGDHEADVLTGGCL